MEINKTNFNNLQPVAQAEKNKAKFERIEDMAQSGYSDYSNAILVKRGITLEEAKEIAANDPEIDYFVYLKGWQMVLGVHQPYNPEKDPLGLISRGWIPNGNGYLRIFRHGDVVFFKAEGKNLGEANDLADAYVKVRD